MGFSSSICTFICQHSKQQNVSRRPSIKTKPHHGNSSIFAYIFPQEHEEYARELAAHYKISPQLPYHSIIEELKNVLDSKRSDLQKLYKLKAGVQKLRDAAGKSVSAVMPSSNDFTSGPNFTGSKEGHTLDRKSSRVTTSAVIKSINSDVQDLAEDICDLETSLLLLKHCQPSFGSYCYL